MMVIFLVSSPTRGGATKLMATMNKTAGDFYDWDADGRNSITITGGATFHDNGDIRSGNKGQVSDLVFPGTLSAVPSSEQLTVDYKYVAGYGCVGTSNGATFDLKVAGATVATQGPFEDYPFDSCSGNGCPTCYSPSVTFSVPGPLSSGEVRISVTNNNRNIHLTSIVIRTSPSPTPSPTPLAPTTTTTAGNSVGAAGDPHMTSVTGAKFDILRPGNHTLLHIPQHSLQEAALVFVRAFVKQEGATCLDMYIESLHITGKLAEERQRGGFSFFANQDGGVNKGWLSLGKLDLKVVYATTVSGVRYLNMFARHLAKLGMPIGGILGLDDHESAVTREAGCQRRLALYSYIPEEDIEESGGRASRASF
jgi:hypothetical protein